MTVVDVQLIAVMLSGMIVLGVVETVTGVGDGDDNHGENNGDGENDQGDEESDHAPWMVVMIITVVMTVLFMMVMVTVLKMMVLKAVS